MRRARTIFALALGLTAIAAVGCGDSGDGKVEFGELVSHLPPATATIEAVDVDGLRSDLGLGSEADATDAQSAFKNGVTPQDPEQRLVRETGIAFAALGQELNGTGSSPVLDAFDGSQVHSVVSTGDGNISITAVSTSQSFDEIAGTLSEQGYTRAGGVLSAASSQDPIGGVADGGDGIVIVARSASLASDAAEEKSGPKDLSRLLGSVDGPVRAASAGSDTPEGDCLSGISVGQTADATSGTVVLELSGDANPAQLDTDELDATDPTFDFAEPKADGSKLTIDYSGPAPDVANKTPLEGLIDTFTVYNAYNCK
ncbi:hypothetical protein BH10ACT11_BH10ACT11_08380 [soil metagenome]